MNFLTVKRRAFFRSGKDTSYDGLTPCSVALANKYVEAKIELSAKPNEASYLVGKGDAIDCARDAFLTERYTECQEILWAQAAAPLHLSVTGTYGYVTSPRFARREALESRISSLEESDELMQYIRNQSGKNFRSARAAARWIQSVDGEYAGLDVHDEITVGKGTRILTVSGCGCVHDELRRAFPDLASVIPWHLADMKSGTTSQIQAIEAERMRIADSLKASGHPHGQVYSFDYKAQCDYLDSIGLLEDTTDEQIFVTGHGMRSARGYRYGTGWVASKVPDDVLARVHAMMTEQEREAA